MKLSVREIATFGFLGGLMYASKIIMDILPNIHLICVFIIAITAVYGKKALYPIYIFVLLTGLFNGFNLWWIPYLYIWLPPFLITLLLPRKINSKLAPFIYAIICGLHGYLYGTLYAPFQALAFGLNFKGMIAWIAAGLPFDLIHGTSNLICGILIIPLIKLIRLCEKNLSR